MFDFTDEQKMVAKMVRRWCDESGLAITHFDSQESGFTVRAVRG